MGAKGRLWIALAIAGVALARTAAGENWRLLREAEEADAVVAPAHVVPNPQARQGKCVMLSEGGASVRSTLRDLGPDARAKSGELDFDLEVPQAGRYRVWVRAQWHCVCSNSFYLLSTGNAEVVQRKDGGVDESQSEPFRVKVSIPPRTWRWLPAATCDFTAGKQKLRLVQAGHEALIDAIMVGSDLDEPPPGYEDQSRACAFSLQAQEGGEQVAWSASGADTRVCPLGSVNWADFQLDFLAGADSKAGGSDGAWGIAFAQQPNASSYAVLFSGSGNGGVKASLYAVEKGRRRTLASQDCGTLAPRDAHWVRVVRLADSISVALDGITRLTATDSTFGGGTVSLLAEKREGYDFQGLQLTPLQNYLEHFQAGIGDWRIHAGTWRAVKPDNSDTEGMACLGSGGDGGGLTTPGWSLGEKYVLSAPIQLSKEGAAGLAFDVQDATHYSALVLRWREGETVEAQFERIADGQRELLLSQGVNVDPRQWHTLRLIRKADLATAQLDGVDLGKCWATGMNVNGGVGLCVAPASACLFGPVVGRSSTSPGNDEFLVEGVEAPITLCQWRPVEGTVRVQGHPAALFLSATRAGDAARLEFQRETEGDVRLEAVFYKYGSAAAKPADPLAALPDLMLPPLPDAPRVGIVFHRREGGEDVEYALLSDWESMREVVLQRNGQILERAYAAKSSHPEGYKLFLQIRGSNISGGVSGASEIHSTLPNSEATRISVTARNFAPHDEAGIVEMRICD